MLLTSWQTVAAVTPKPRGAAISRPQSTERRRNSGSSPSFPPFPDAPPEHRHTITPKLLPRQIPRIGPRRDGRRRIYCKVKHYTEKKEGHAVQLPFLVTAVAILLGTCLPEDSVALLSLLLTQLADTLATTAALAGRAR